MMMQNKAAFALYKEMLGDGVPRELARTVLPVATYSHMFASVSLLNLLKFIKLRSHTHSQYEIRTYSDALLEIIKGITPITVAAAIEHWL
jgi:thymidylate synthase (FAD)